MRIDGKADVEFIDDGTGKKYIRFVLPESLAKASDYAEHPHRWYKHIRGGTEYIYYDEELEQAYQALQKETA